MIFSLINLKKSFLKEVCVCGMHVCVCMFVCVYMSFISVAAHVCADECRDLRLALGVFLYHSVLYFNKTGSLTEL